MAIEREASLLLKGEDKGVTKLLGNITKSSINLNREVAKTATGFQDIGESIPNKSLDLFSKTSKRTIGSVDKLGRSMRGVSSNYSGFIDKTEKANSILEASDNLFVKLGANALGYGKTLDTVSSGLGPAANFWQQYSRASSGAGKSLVVVKAAGKTLNPVLGKTSDLALQGAKSFEQMGGVAAALADPLAKISQNLGKTQKGLKIAGFASDVNQMLEGVKEFKEETLPELQEQLEETLETVEKLGIKEKFFGSTFKTLNTTATVLSATTKGLSKNASDTFLQFVKFLEIKGYVSIVTGAVVELNRTLNDTYRSVDELQNLGIDTSFQESALSVGVFGEKLLASTEAAKKFRQQATGAFARFQDQLAYLTTLSSAAARGQEKLGDSILAMVNGPLKNSVSALDAAAGYYDALSAGQASIEFLNASLKFSAATGANATDSIGALAQVHNIYRLNARNATKTAALFNATIENGVINGAEMASGIGQLASVAKSAGIDITELNAMLAALTKNGFSAADAFQGLMSLITAIAGQGSESAKAAQELGVRFDFARIKAEGLMKPINDLYSAARGSDARIKTIVPDALAYRTAIALATNASNDFIDVQGKMENLDNKSLDAVFERRRDSILQRSQELRDGFNNEMIRFGQDLQETITPAIAAGEMLLNNFQQLPEPARNLILATSKINIPIEKTQQAVGILGSSVGNLAKAFVMAKAAFLGFGLVMGGKGRQKLLTIVDLIKNQKDYIGALKTFLGVSDSVAERITNLTKLEKTQFLQNRKLLQQRQQAVVALKGIESIEGVNLFSQNPKEVSKNINRAFKNATPLVKEKAHLLKNQIIEQFQDFKVAGSKSNILVRGLGLDRVKDTETELAAALGKITQARGNGLRNLNIAPGEKQAYQERLNLIEQNIKNRQELLGLSRTQLELEREGVKRLTTQITAATAGTKGTITQAREIITNSLANKQEVINNLRQTARNSIAAIDDDITRQVRELSPRFASVLANKTGTELEFALNDIRRGLGNNVDQQVEELAKTFERRRDLITTSKNEIKTIQSEGKALRKVTQDRKLDLVERSKVAEAIASEIATREKNIASLEAAGKIDFLDIVAEEDVREKIQAGFSTASQETQEQVGKLADNLKANSEEIFENEEAFSILDAIGLGDVEGNLEQLEEVANKLDEIKEAGQADPEAIALVEENLETRQALAAATAAETAALRTQNASLAEQNIVLGANNLQRAQAIGFIGPLAAWNTKLTASYLATTAAVNNVTASGVLNAAALKTQAAATKLLSIAKLGLTKSLALVSAGLKKMWLALGPIGIGVIALTGAFVALSKMRGQIKMLDETKYSLDNLLVSSQQFQEQIDLSRQMRSLGEDLRVYSQELRQSAVDARLAGEDATKIKEKLDRLGDLDIEVIKKSGREFDTIRKVSLTEYINTLDLASESILEYNSSSQKTFDGVTVKNSIQQSKRVAEVLQEQAAAAKLAGDNLEAINYERLAERAESVANSAVLIQQQFEASLDKETLKIYRKNQERLEKEREKFDQKALKKRGTTSFVKTENEIASRIDGVIKIYAEKNDQLQAQIDRLNNGELFSQAARPTDEIIDRKRAEVEAIAEAEQEKLQIIENSQKAIAENQNRSVVQDAKNKMADARKEFLKLVEERQAAKSQYNTLIEQRNFTSRSDEIIAEAKANKQAAALSGEAFKELLEAEQEVKDTAIAATDREAENLQNSLDLLKENGTITQEEIANKQREIDKLKELNSAREEAFKAQVKRLKEAQSAANLIDQNNAAKSVQDLATNFNRARIKIIEETLDDTTKASAEYKKLAEGWQEDANKIAEIPAKFRTTSLKYFDRVSRVVQEGMNTSTSYQRRQLAIATNGLAELATNVENVEKKGVEAAQGAIDKAIENAQVLQASGALTPEAIAAMYREIRNLSSEVEVFGVKGSIALASQLDAIFEGELANQQEAVNRIVAINRRGIEEISHLEAIALLTSHQAEEERLSLEVRNNELVYQAAQERYNQLATLRGEDTKETLEAYGEMIVAERSLQVSQFQRERAAETRKLEIATAKYNAEVDLTVLKYNRELDELGLINAELGRREKIITSYNQTLNASLSFLDDLNKVVSSSVKDERDLAALRERQAVRNLEVLKIQQVQELEAQKRQIEYNLLKAEEALINNDIEIASKDREISLAKVNFEQEKKNRQLRQDEIEAFELKLENLERERSLLDVQESKIIDNYQAEKLVSEENLKQLELKQEQARSGGTIDVIDAKLGKITARYREQEKIIAANSNSFNNRVSYLNNILGLANQVVDGEKEQKRLAQIVAQTKLKNLKKQQDFERRTLEIQQAQNIALLEQEKIKLKILKAQQQAAITEDTSKLIEAQQNGDEQQIKSLSALLDSRLKALGTIEAGEKSLNQRLAIQKQLNAVEQEGLKFKQKEAEFAAKIAVNETRPDGKRKENERKRLRRELLNEVGLNPSQLKVETFNAPTAKTPKGTELKLSQDLGVDSDIARFKEEFFGKLGLKSPTDGDNTLEREFNEAKEKAFPGSTKDIIDYVDPSMRSQFTKDFGSYNPSTTIPLPPKENVNTPIPSDYAEDKWVQQQTNHLDIAKAQLIAQKIMVEELVRGNQQKKTGDMYNEININSADAETGAEEIEDIFLNKLDDFVTKLENRSQ